MKEQGWDLEDPVIPQSTVISKEEGPSAGMSPWGWGGTKTRCLCYFSSGKSGKGWMLGLGSPASGQEETRMARAAVSALPAPFLS